MSPFIFSRTARRTMLALALSAWTGLAAAASSYHVAIDTSSFGGAGWLDLQFNPGNAGASAAAVALTHFSGAFDDGAASGLLPVFSGDVSGSFADGLRFGNRSDYNDLFHAVNFGGRISFDLTFSGAADPSPHLIKSLFSVAAYGADQVSLLGNYDGISGSLLQFSWTPSPTVADGGMLDTYVHDGANVAVSAVPEPSAWLMLAAGMAMLGVRRRGGRSAA